MNMNETLASAPISASRKVVILALGCQFLVGKPRLRKKECGTRKDPQGDYIACLIGIGLAGQS